MEQLTYNCDTELQSFQQHMQNLQLIPEQLDAYQCFVDAVLSCAGTAFFLSGPAGTDKTYIYKTICHRL